MTSGNWQEIERIYLAASDLPAADRAGYLERACGGDPAMRAEVEKMLRADDAATGFLESPPSRIAADFLSTQAGALAPGERIGDYQVRLLISIGGMGEVYFAGNIHSGQPVALKLIRRHLISDARAADRFAVEARAAGALHHPNVVAIYEFGTSEAGMFIAMEWVDGKTWRALMDAGGIALSDAIGWARQAAGGLTAAHEAGVMHRDLKPENLMLGLDGIVKMLDFGLARQAGSVLADVEASGASGTISGTLSGTLSYMPPEVFRGETATGATDVFSLGVVFYELFSGIHPFAGETPLDIYEAIECRVPERPSTVRDGISPALDNLLLRMLNRDRDLRPDAGEVASELNRIRI